VPETKATLKYLRTSPYKVREVLDLVRGKDVGPARDVLRFAERSAAGEVLKVLDSAIANAEHNMHIPADELFVSVAFADEGPTLKRWRPRARGRATRIRKRTSHVTIVVARHTNEELQRRRAIEAAQQTRRGRRLPGRRRAATPATATAAAAATTTGDLPDPTAVDAPAADEVLSETPVADEGAISEAVEEALAAPEAAPADEPVAEAPVAEEPVAEAPAPEAPVAADEAPAAEDAAAPEEEG